MTRSDPAVVLTGADLDLLELALGDALPAGLAVRKDALSAGVRAGSVIFTDAENTPLARFVAQGDGEPGPTIGGLVQALKSQALRVGPAADPRLRRPAAVVRGESAAATTAVVFRAVPSMADLDTVRARLAGCDERILWVAMVSRARRGADAAVVADAAVGLDALVRAVQAARPEDAVALVVPDPTGGAVLDPRGAGVGAVLERYGAHRSIDVLAERAAGSPAPDPCDEGALRSAYPPASADELLRAARRAGRASGAMILITGLSGSGKSTLAAALADRLEDTTQHRVSVLDGDEVRQLLSSELGFDRRSRELNVTRIGYVGALVARSGGIAIAAPIAPFAQTRAEVRRRVEAQGRFLLVYVSTPLAVCEARDRKGLYARARRGEIPEFTGISSPYEVPQDADVVLDMGTLTVHEAVDTVLAALAAALAGDGGTQA